MQQQQQVESASDSPTPTPMNTATHTPAPSTWPTPWSSPKLGPTRDVLRFSNIGFALGSMSAGAGGITRRAKVRQLALYFVLNLSLTILNKALLAKVSLTCSFLELMMSSFLLQGEIMSL